MTDITANDERGSIVCVGVGMILGSHISALSRNFIEQADIVFVGASDKLVEMWISEMNPNTVSLQQFYEEGKARTLSYQQMVEAMLAQVRAGKQVVGAFYGHPGVFAWAPHQVIKQALSEGYQAHMEPGISAEDCLYADMGIDPGTSGAVHIEASKFLLYERTVDITSYLILWQIGFVGDFDMKQYRTSSEHKLILKQVLLSYYPPEHKVAIYESPTLPTDQPRIEWFTLGFLDSIQIEHHSTLVIPPARRKQIDLKIKHMIENLK